jgi:hypothetical protein
MTERDDHDLHDRFQELRREDLEHATPFMTMLATARARRTVPPRRGALRLAPAVVAAVALFFLLSRRHRDGVPIDLATVRWQAPTDFLLQLPGEELLRTVPEFLTPHDLDRRIP